MATLEEIYLFRHAAYRDAAYDLQLPSARALLHARALEIFEVLFDQELHLVAAELAVHARLAQRDAPRETAVKLAQAEFRYLMIQVQQESRRAQWDGVIHTTDRMFECEARTDEALLKAYDFRIQALEFTGRRRDAEQAALELAELGRKLDIPSRVVTGLCTAATCQFNLGRHEEALETFAKAERAAGDTAALHAKIYMDRALHANARGDFAENERLLLQALELADSCERRLRLGLRGNLANLYGNTGRHELAIAELVPLAAEFAETGDMRGEATVYANLGRQYLLSGNLSAAAENLQRAVDLAREIGVWRSVAFALANLARVELALGKLDAALASAEQALDIFSEQGLPLYHAAYECTLALVHLALGHEKLAAELAENARAEFATVHGETFAPEYCNPVRMRIAAWQAVSMTVPGRETSKLRAAPPSPSWLPVMRQLLREMERSRDERGESAGTQLTEAIESARNLVNEMEAAVKEKRPALVFRGFLPSELLPEARQAFAARLKEQSPAEYATLRKLHPDLWQALNQDG